MSVNKIFMDFLFSKSTHDSSRGCIYYRYSPISSPECKIEDSTNSEDAAARNGKNVKVSTNKSDKGKMSKRKKCKCVQKATALMDSKKPDRTRMSLGIDISYDEWNTYRSGSFGPSSEMPSLGISYAKFDKFMKLIREAVDSNRNTCNMKFVIQSLVMKLITQTQ